MTNLSSELISKIIQEQISQDQDNIAEHITAGVDNTMPLETITAKMIFNSIGISVQISAKVILELMFQSGLVEELDTKSLLKQLSSFHMD